MPNERAKRILDSIVGSGINALMVFKPENIFYLTGFWGNLWPYAPLMKPNSSFPS